MANNNILYNAVLSAAAAAMFSARWITSAVQADYADEGNVAQAIATQVDAGIVAGNFSQAQANMLANLVLGAFDGRNPQSIVAADYATIATAVIAAFNQFNTELLTGGSQPGAQIAFSFTNLVIPNMLAVTNAEVTVAVPGAALNDLAIVNITDAILTNGIAIGNVRVSLANTVAICFVNASAGAIDPPDTFDGVGLILKA